MPGVRVLMALSAADYDERGTRTLRARARHGDRRRRLLGPVPVTSSAASCRATWSARSRRPRQPTWARATWTSPWHSPSTGSTPPGTRPSSGTCATAASRRRRTEGDPEFRWRRYGRGARPRARVPVRHRRGPEGRNFKPKSGAGSRFQAFNVAGVRLLPADNRPVEVEAERLDGGLSRVQVRVAGLAPFVTLYFAPSRTATTIRTPTTSSTRSSITPTDRPVPAARSPQAP